MQYKANPKRKMENGGSMIEGPGDKMNKTITNKYTMQDLTPEQRKKINSIDLSPSAKQKAINAFAKQNQ